MLTLTAYASFVGVATYILGTRNGVSASAVDTSSTSPLERPAKVKYASEKEMKAAFAELRKLLDEDQVQQDESDLERHGNSAFVSYIPAPGENTEPNIIVLPRNTEEVSAIVKIAHRYRIPVVSVSGSTSLEGHYYASKGGICVDFSNMDKIIAINDQDMDVVVQPAVGWEDLNHKLEKYGLFFAPDPGPGAKIGGMVGTGCSGTNAARYGTMRENVINLTVVLADGTVIKTRQRPRKSSAGYDLTRLFIGSEGTLGLITEATLKVIPLPQERSVAVCAFPTIRDAASAVQQIIRSGVGIGAIELLDENQMMTINKTNSTKRKWKEQPTLFLKFDGTKSSVKDTAHIVEGITKNNKGSNFEFARNELEKEELWSARKEALWSIMAMRQNDGDVWTTDVAVPISKLPDLIAVSKKDIENSGIFSSIVAHAGDGKYPFHLRKKIYKPFHPPFCFFLLISSHFFLILILFFSNWLMQKGNFHAILLYDKNEHQKAEDLVHKMVHNALALEGTCTGMLGVLFLFLF